MPDPMVNATVTVAQGSTAVTSEVATILAESLSGLGLGAQLGESDASASSTPIIVFGQGATAAPPMSMAQARRAIIVLLAGPGTQAFKAAVGLAEFAVGCFAVSPRTVALLRDQGIRTDRFVLGHTDRWDTGGGANRSRSIDIVHTGELDGSGRRLLARIAPELAQMRSHIDVTARRLTGPGAPPAFESSVLLADAMLTLSLNRWGNTTLDWPTVVRAMCNGSVVIAERTTGYGELVPGEHFLMARAERIGPAIRASRADPQGIADMAAAAYELCRTELAMNDSVDRVAAAAAGRSRVRRPMQRRRALPLGATRSSATTPQRLEFKAVDPLAKAPDADAEIDVICVEHDRTGPISLTRDSLAGHPVRVNLHVGVIETSERHQESPDPQSSAPAGTAIADARNAIVSRSSAPLVMFVDSGDEILGDALGRLVAALGGSPQADICLPIVALGSEDLAYPPRPDSPGSLADGAALQRGYVVRRSYLDRVGPFMGGGDGAAGVDRAFWRRAAAVGGRVALLPQLGLRLWQT